MTAGLVEVPSTVPQSHRKLKSLSHQWDRGRSRLDEYSVLVMCMQQINGKVNISSNGQEEGPTDVVFSEPPRPAPSIIPLIKRSKCPRSAPSHLSAIGRSGPEGMVGKSLGKAREKPGIKGCFGAGNSAGNTISRGVLIVSGVVGPMG